MLENLPYFPFTQTVQGNTILTSNEPTFINGMCKRACKISGSVPHVLNMALQEYYSEDNLCYLEVVFDFGTHCKLCLWQSEAESLAAMIGEDIFQQKIFFISIHSEVTCSDLFAGKGGDGSDVAVRPEEVSAWFGCSPIGIHLWLEESTT
ncbi:hypothetical protein EDC04DRAFT_2762610 [Pisolithus marmoratus]|nr:hypothetical protein EDC04DRAFT_2762610 [Pisolithus marmoratus]